VALIVVGAFAQVPDASQFRIATSARTVTFWTPSQEQIADFERSISSVDIDKRYARFYAGLNFGTVSFHNKTFPDLWIQAQFIPLRPGEIPSIHIIGNAKLPPLKSEGCIASDRLSPQPTARRPINLRCSAPGIWTPSDVEIADLERNLILPNGAYAIERYSRHYAGVTSGDKPMIRAVYVFTGDTFEYSPGTFIESDVEIPTISDGGCRVIAILYDPVAQRAIFIECNGVG